MKKRKTIATQCDCCDGIIYCNDTIDIFRHSFAQYEGSIFDFSSEKMNRGQVIKHLCNRCGERFTDVDLIRMEAAKAFNIELRSNPSPFKWECDQCGAELRRGHSWLSLDIVSTQIGFGSYHQKRDDCLLELCATCGARIGTEEARAGFHNLIVAIAQELCTLESDHDEDSFRDEKIVQKHTAPVDPEKLAEAGIVTREHLKGRFFRIDIDCCSSGIWETDGLCGRKVNIDYDEFELPEWLLKRFYFWEHWYDQFSPMDNLPIDMDWQSFYDYGRSLAVDLKYHLGPDISVCYMDKEITLGPVMRNPVIRERLEPELVWKGRGIEILPEGGE
ncbi:MAG: hypothetical protein FIA89_03960 [Geobacter sp.]|nr:hypothetical protein [Geobacter sp.]